MGFLKKIIKKIKNRVSERYNSNREYVLAKSLVMILVLPGAILLSLYMLSGIISRNVSIGEVFAYLFWIVMCILFRLFLDGIVESIFLKSGKITANMKELPKNIGSKNTIIQYNLSENITPSEAGILLYGRAEISNILCLIYKWINEKKIILYVENGKKYLQKIQGLGEGACDYERFLFGRLFHSSKRPILFDKKLLNMYVSEFNDMVVESCMGKGYIDNNINLKGVNRFFVSKSDVSGDKPIVKRNPAIRFLSWVLLFPGLPIIANLLGGIGILVWIVLMVVINFNYVSNVKYFINLTDKGKEALSQIYGYKYYLEHCEEDQINSDLGDGEIYSKHLPYAIALKLNWKIIKELS